MPPEFRPDPSEVESDLSPLEPGHASGTAETPSGDDFASADESPGGAAYLADVPVPDEYRPAIDHIGRELAMQGVGAPSIAQGLQWLVRSENQTYDNSVRTDSYRNIDAAGFNPDEVPGLNAFLAEMDKARVPEQDVRAMLDHYKELRTKSASHAVEARRELTDDDGRDRSRTERELATRWGENYQANMAAAKRRFTELPEAERRRFLTERTAAGVLLANDPQSIAWLIQDSRPQPVRNNSYGTGNVDAEISAIEKRMRNDRAGYNRDEALQQRYRQLLSQRGPR